ncbi:mitotic checkpoint regulator, MAD2B-interacting-domain-containing protein [Lactifluus subvellereus]|nr:mitotic checkpoint regulator, MAD2B-interacting-domain-containing protein [Lactifluus subvellereus]
MLVDAYGSDNSDNSDGESALPSQAPPQQKKPSSISLPAPSNPSTSGSSAALALPAPKAKRAPKKIAIDLPALPKDGSAEDDDEARPAKRSRTDTRGAGSSTLFSMLPTPKLAAPVKAAPERVLGSGKGPGLVFNNPPTRKAEDMSDIISNDDPQSILEATVNEQPPSLPFMPASVRKGKANISLEESSTSNTVTTDPARPSSTAMTPPMGSTSSLSISSAPKIDEYTPPEPTPDDPYPGYYQLPSGTWAAYDPAYYDSSTTSGRLITTAGSGHLKRKRKALKMEKAKKDIQEREEKKALTRGAGGEVEAPRMNVKGSKISKGARKRGQLASLLVEAYQNREVLEEKIAEGRRNRKEAGNRYD